MKQLKYRRTGNVIGTKPGSSTVIKNGIINEGEQVNDKTILIGMTESSSDNKEVSRTTPKSLKGATRDSG
jgi:CHASE2 domain-containing sensor protein